MGRRQSIFLFICGVATFMRFPQRECLINEDLPELYQEWSRPVTFLASISGEMKGSPRFGSAFSTTSPITGRNLLGPVPAKNMALLNGGGELGDMQRL